MVEVVAVPALLDRVAAGDDVEQQPAAGDPLERRRPAAGGPRQPEVAAQRATRAGGAEQPRWPPKTN
jgi:hypothetical protein